VLLTGPTLSPLGQLATRNRGRRDCTWGGTRLTHQARRSASPRRSEPCFTVTRDGSSTTRGRPTHGRPSCSSASWPCSHRSKRHFGLCVGCKGVLTSACGSAFVSAVGLRGLRRGSSPATSRSSQRRLTPVQPPAGVGSRTSRKGATRPVIDAIGVVLGSHAKLLDIHTDADHNRSVFTLVARRKAAHRRLALPASPAAREHIDLAQTTWVRTRASAQWMSCRSLPLRPQDMDRGAKPRRSSSPGRIGEELELARVPLWRALAPERGPAFFFAAAGPEELQRRIDVGEVTPELRAEAGLDPSAGGVIVGARAPVDRVSNVKPSSARTSEAAQEIARVIRERDGGLSGRCARLGLHLPQAGHAAGEHERRGLGGRGALHEIVAAGDRARGRGAGRRGRRRRARRP